MSNVPFIEEKYLDPQIARCHYAAPLDERTDYDPHELEAACAALQYEEAINKALSHLEHLTAHWEVFGPPPNACTDEHPLIALQRAVLEAQRVLRPESIEPLEASK